MAPSSAKIAWLLCCLVIHTKLPAQQGLRMRSKNNTQRWSIHHGDCRAYGTKRLDVMAVVNGGPAPSIVLKGLIT